MFELVCIFKYIYNFLVIKKRRPPHAQIYFQLCSAQTASCQLKLSCEQALSRDRIAILPVPDDERLERRALRARVLSLYFSYYL